LLAAGVLIYSGTAWLWLRPALHKTLINKYAGEYKFDPLWVMSIIRVESRFAPSAQSSRGAVGLMQLLPSTARELAPEIGLGHFKDEDLKDPDTNLHLGFQYLAKLKHEFPDDEVAVLAAYNAGPRITQQWRKGKPVLEMDDIPYPETRRFVQQVQYTYTILKALQRWKRLFGID
jgi:soluble lytic murein transglycosylase